jgi:hypothetical protein
MIPKATDKVFNGNSRHPNDPKKARMSKSQVKILLITFFNIKGTFHFEFVPQGQTVKQAYHVEILKQLYEAVHREGAELWPNSWILYHDNAPAHRALSGQRKKSITEMELPLCSPNLASNDFWLFPEIVYLKGTKISGYRIRQKI